MSTIKRSLVALLLAPVVVGATMPGSAVASRAHQPIVLRAVLHGRALRVTGSNFDASSHVTVALIDIRSWQVTFKGSATTEAATYECRTGTSIMCCRKVSSIMCGRPDPNAGALDFQTILHQRPRSTVLAILYRTGNGVGFGRVLSQ